MPAPLITFSSGSLPAFLPNTRAKRVLLVVLFAVCLAAGFAYHLLTWQTGVVPSPLVQALYNAVVLFGFVLLWLLLSFLNELRPSTPAKTFWTILLAGLGLITVGRLAISLASPAEALPITSSDAFGFDLGTGTPRTIEAVATMNIISILEAGFSILLLVLFRGLVLFKRTKGSQRNWYLMLGFMVLAPLTAFMKDPNTDDFAPLQAIAMVPAVGLMVVNSFRLSWIVFLSFKEKAASIGLAALLLAFLAVSLNLGESTILPGAETYLKHYSYPLTVFALLTTVFGILYCATTVLSLLFHLPTTGDFQQKAGEVVAIHALTTLVSQVFDQEKLAQTIVASACETGSAHGSWLAVADPSSGSLRPTIIASYKVPAGRLEQMVDMKALYEEVYSKRQPIILQQAPADHRVSTRPGDGLGSLLVVPLTARDDVLGALFVIKDVTYGFEEHDIDAAKVFAAQAALALDHARLFEEQIEKERLTRELDIAREVQRKLLPQKLPCVPGISIHASSVPAQEVGGDYYDFSELDDGRLAFIIGDVSGKGTSAAFYMAEVQGIFHAMSRLSPAPVDFLTHANRALAHTLEKHIFVSAVYGVLDFQNEVLTIARAGHCPAAVIRLDGEARLLRTQGIGLGLAETTRFRNSIKEERVRLQPGDVFVLYTDGVVESRNPAGEEYGYERLLQALREHRHEDAPLLHEALLDDLRHFIGEKPYDDDMTLVVLKWHGISFARPVPRDGREGARALPERSVA